MAVPGGPLSLLGEGGAAGACTGRSLPARAEVTAAPGTCHPRWALQAQKGQRFPSDSIRTCPVSIDFPPPAQEREAAGIVQVLGLQPFPGTSAIPSLLTNDPRAAVGVSSPLSWDEAAGIIQDLGLQPVPWSNYHPLFADQGPLSKSRVNSPLPRSSRSRRGGGGGSPD